MEFAYKKSLGQNFIYDTDFLHAMVAGLNITKDDVVIEVGAGAGTLTQVLAKTGCQVHSVEIDQRLQPILQKNLSGLDNVELIFGDAMQYDFSKFGKFRLIANVPYYITTPLVMKFLRQSNCTDINILVASDVANRIVAPVGKAEYGALSVTCQLMAQCEITKFVPRRMFTPQPKVDSAFVRIQKFAQPFDENLSRLLKGVFAARRKTMQNALASAWHLDKERSLQILEQANIVPTLRPEQITPTQYAKICELLPKIDK